MTRSTLHVATPGSNRIINPFPGLRPFGIQESFLYFGREGQSDEILEILSKNKFINILGSSGTGKSSLMFSGVIPTLHAGFLSSKGGEWEVITARPGLNPIENLAKSFARLEEKDKKPSRLERIANQFLFESILRRSSKGLIDVYHVINTIEGKSLLIYLDQFEEIFRFRKQGSVKYLNESLAYVNLIIEAVVQKETPIYIALSMRSDFLGECEQFPELTNKINESHFLIPQMTREQKRLVVSGPVAVGNASVSNRLVQRLLNDMGDRPDQLPVLQHALMRTWDYWQKNSTRDEPIDFIHYEAIGGVNEALSRHADEAYYELNDLEKEICERLFKTITEKRNDSDGIRRPTRLEEISKIIDEDEEIIKKVIDKFREHGRALLMPPPDVELNSASVIDISHEALMRVWYRLRNWVEEESASSKVYVKLSEAARNYQQGVGSLWRPPDLQLAIEWRNKTKPTLKWALQYDNNFESVISFLHQSEEAYRLEIENKERIQRKRLRQTRLVASVLGTAAMVSLVMLVVAFNQKLEADLQTQIAEKNSIEAKASADLAERNRITALQRADQATKSTKQANIQRQIAEINAREAEKAKVDADLQRRTAIQREFEAVSALKEADKQRGFALEQTQKAQISEGESQRLLLLSVAKTIAIKSQQIDDPQLQALLAYQAYKFYRDNNGYQYDNDIYNGLFNAIKSIEPNHFEAFSGRAREVRSMYLDKQNRLYTNGSDGKIYEWNLNNQGSQSGKVIYDSKNQLLKKVTISEDTRTLACLMNDANLYIKDLNSSGQGLNLKLPFKYAYDLSFAKGTSDVYVSASDSVVYKFSNQKATPLIKASGRIFSFKLFNNGQYMITGSENGRVDIWDVKNNRFVSNVYKKTNTVIHAIAVNEAANLVALGDNKGQIQVIRLKEDFTSGQIIDLPGQDDNFVSEIVFNDKNNQLVSSSTDGSIHIWDLSDPDEFPIIISETPGSWVLSIALDANNSLLAGCKERTFRSYPIHSPSLAILLGPKIRRELTQEEWRRYIGEDIPYESLFNEPTSPNER